MWCWELKSGALQQPRGMGWGKREVQEEGDIGILRLIHVDVWQKLTPYCHYLPMKTQFFKKERNKKTH